MHKSTLLTTGQIVSYAVWSNLAQVIHHQNYEPQRVVILSPDPIPDSVDAMLPGYCLSGLGDTAQSVAIGIATANPALKVFVLGQIDSFSPLIYQRGITQNHNLTVVTINRLDNWGVGQQIISTQLPGYVARASSSQPQLLQQMLIGAAKFDGLAIVEVLQPDTDASQLSFSDIHSHGKIVAAPAADQAQAHNGIRSTNPLYLGLLWRRPSPSYQTKLLKQFGAPLVDKPLTNTVLKDLLATFK